MDFCDFIVLYTKLFRVFRIQWICNGIFWISIIYYSWQSIRQFLWLYLIKQSDGSPRWHSHTPQYHEVSVLWCCSWHIMHLLSLYHELLSSEGNVKHQTSELDLWFYLAFFWNKLHSNYLMKPLKRNALVRMAMTVQDKRVWQSHTHQKVDNKLVELSTLQLGAVIAPYLVSPVNTSHVPVVCCCC